MQAQVELLKTELDRMRGALEEIANGEPLRKDGPGYWGFALRLRGLAVSVLAFADDAAAARALERDSCTHREGDGVCAACGGVER